MGILIAIDQAKTSGFSVWDGTELIQHGTIELGRKQDVYEEILHFAQNKIEKLIKKTNADMVVIEDTQQQRNVLTYKKLNLLMGSLLALFQRLELRWEIVPPPTWRAFCKIKAQGRSDVKAETIKFVKEQFGIEVCSDAADAIAMGWYAVHSLVENKSRGRC